MSNYRLDQNAFFVELERKAKEMEITAQKLEDQKLAGEFIDQFMSSGGAAIVPLPDLAKVYKESVRTMQRALKVSEDQAHALTRQLILKSIDLARSRNSK